MASAQSRPELTMLAWVCARRVPSASLRRARTVPGTGTGDGTNQGRVTRPPVWGTQTGPHWHVSGVAVVLEEPQEAGDLGCATPLVLED